jgi:hypothetical protein
VFTMDVFDIQIIVIEIETLQIILWDKVFRNIKIPYILSNGHIVAW